MITTTNYTTITTITNNYIFLVIVSSRHYLVETEDGAAENKDITKAETIQTIQNGADYFPWSMRLCMMYA